MLVLAAGIAGCRGISPAATPSSMAAGGSGSTGPEASAPVSPEASTRAEDLPDGDGRLIREVIDVEGDLERLRDALLGDEPYPSSWPQSVGDTIDDVERMFDDLRLPAVDGLAATEAACATWGPLVGNVGWSTGAFLERRVFIAHARQLAEVAPAEIRDAAREADDVAAAAAAEQLREDGDPSIVSQPPDEAIEAIGRWAVAQCELPVEADDPPDTAGWTDEEIAQSCRWDHDWMVQAQEEYVTGPGEGRYAEHPHLLEVAIRWFAYPAWHRLVDVDNAATPPSFAVEPIPGAFCDV
jgi:hypothetical protein